MDSLPRIQDDQRLQAAQDKQQQAAAHVDACITAVQEATEAYQTAKERAVEAEALAELDDAEHVSSDDAEAAAEVEAEAKAALEQAERELEKAQVKANHLKVVVGREKARATQEVQEALDAEMAEALEAFTTRFEAAAAAFETAQAVFRAYGGGPGDPGVALDVPQLSYLGQSRLVLGRRDERDLSLDDHKTYVSNCGLGVDPY